MKVSHIGRAASTRKPAIGCCGGRQDASARTKTRRSLIELLKTTKRQPIFGGELRSKKRRPAQ